MDTRAQESLVAESKTTYDSVVELSDIALALVGGGVGEIVVG